MDLGISGRRAAVAAASKGLGLATARALVAEGVHVAICGRDEERINAAAAQLGELAVPIVADVSDGDGGAAFVAAASAELGGVDILVTNAGGPPPGGFADVATDAYPAALDLNLMSTVGMVNAAVPAMREQGWGRVVAITSIAVRQPMENLVLSNTARAGATGFLKTAALALVGTGVTVNSVQPGLHATDRMTTLYGADADITMGDPADFGAAVAFLCSQQANFITGAALHIDGGDYKALL